MFDRHLVKLFTYNSKAASTYAVRYTNVPGPNREIDLYRYSAHNPYCFKENIAEENVIKKKTIVFTDETLSELQSYNFSILTNDHGDQSIKKYNALPLYKIRNNIDIDNLTKLIFTLVLDDFNVYIYGEEGPQKIEKNTTIIESLMKVKAVDDNKVIQYFSKLGIAKDELEILNYANLRKIDKYLRLNNHIYSFCTLVYDYHEDTIRVSDLISKDRDKLDDILKILDKNSISKNIFIDIDECLCRDYIQFQNRNEEYIIEKIKYIVNSFSKNISKIKLIFRVSNRINDNIISRIISSAKINNENIISELYIPTWEDISIYKENYGKHVSKLYINNIYFFSWSDLENYEDVLNNKMVIFNKATLTFKLDKNDLDDKQISFIRKLLIESKEIKVTISIKACNDIYYKNIAIEASETFRYILCQWIPNSKYILDDRPHIAKMGEKYKGEQSDSEEELLIPII